MSNHQQLAKKLLQRYHKLLQQRQNIEANLQEITTYVHPHRDQHSPRTSSISSGRKLYDSTAIIAADQLASCLWSFACDGASHWFRLDKTDQQSAVLDNIEQDIYNILDQSRFYSAAHEFFRDLVSFGTAFFVCDANIKTQDFIFKAIHPLDCAFEEDAKGEIVSLFRKITIQDFDDKDNGDLLHIVIKNSEDFKTISSLPWISIFINLKTGEVTHTGGYHENPYMVARFYTRSQHHWGESPAMQVLADIKTLNLMVKNNLVAAQKQVDPPLLASDELFAKGLRAEAGSIIYGGLDGRSGTKRLEPLLTAGNVNLGFDMEERKRNIIREAFYYQLIHHFHLQKTATQAILDQEDKLRLIYPIINRVFSEFLRPAITRIACILLRDKHGIYTHKIRLQSHSPLALAQRRNEANKMIKSLHHIMPLINIDNKLSDNINTKNILHHLLQNWGFPGDTFNK